MEPHSFEISFICPISFPPGKIAERFQNSPMTQPIDHISTCSLYCESPRRISGARYHCVTTFGVYISFWRVANGSLIRRDKPKSAIFTTPSVVNRIFSVLKSRCMIWLKFGKIEWNLWLKIRDKSGERVATNRFAVHVIQANQHLPHKRLDFSQLKLDVFIRNDFSQIMRTIFK